jgi:GH35 family endo-1,4-beta-xylanase
MCYREEDVRVQSQMTRAGLEGAIDIGNVTMTLQEDDLLVRRGARSRLECWVERWLGRWPGRNAGRSRDPGVGQSAARRLLLAVGVSYCVLLPPDTLSQPLAAGQNKFVGNIIGSWQNIRPDFEQYWNQVTPENAGKWGSVQSGSGVYDWTNLDPIYQYALARGLPYRHHTLIWGQQQPAFLDGLDSAAQYLDIERWIQNTGQRYPQADFCDVVNEPLHAPPAYRNALGGSGATGWDWVIRSFELARQHWSPNTELHINEYSVINDGAANAQYLQIINLLKDRGLIDGIGVQGHGFEVDGGASMATLRANLTNLAATGLPVYITEFDINRADDSVQLQRYQTIFPVLYGHPGVAGITLWGYVQGQIWRPDAYLITALEVKRPAFNWLKTYLSMPLTPVPVAPVNSTGEPRNALFQWRPSALATSYRVQVSTDRAYTTLAVDSTVADTLLRVLPLSAQTLYYWRINAGNSSGQSEYTASAAFITGDQILGVEESPGVPVEFVLEQNHPNPFNPSTRIRYSLPARSRVLISVFDVLGAEVATLADGVREAGPHEVTFDGSRLANGMYLYRLEAHALESGGSGRSGGGSGLNDFVQIRKAILLK